jgi:hypothetical protein
MGVDSLDVERRPGPDGAVYLTPEGAERLRKELEFLQHERRPQVEAWLSEIIAEGVREDDVKGFEEARSELLFIDERIRKLGELLAVARFLDSPDTSDEVQLGSWVTVKEGEQEQTTASGIILSQRPPRKSPRRATCWPSDPAGATRTASAFRWTCRSATACCLPSMPAPKSSWMTRKC